MMKRQPYPGIVPCPPLLPSAFASSETFSLQAVTITEVFPSSMSSSWLPVNFTGPVNSHLLTSPSLHWRHPKVPAPSPAGLPNAFGGTTLNGINNKNVAVGFYVDAAGNRDGLLVNNLP